VGGFIPWPGRPVPVKRHAKPGSNHQPTPANEAIAGARNLFRPLSSRSTDLRIHIAQPMRSQSNLFSSSFIQNPKFIIQNFPPLSRGETKTNMTKK